MTSVPSEAWTIERLLSWMQGYFTEKGMASPRLDAEVLLAQALSVNRTHLYTHYDQPLTISERDALRALVKRRANHEPIAYICGKREFYGRDFEVSRAVLVPRPETEHVVEAALEHAKKTSDGPCRILDIGTGSGAMAVTLAAEIPRAEIIATDVSFTALEVAQKNAVNHGVRDRITFLCGDLFGALPPRCGAFDIIVANPPYIGLRERPTLSSDVRDFEPALALFAGDDGFTVLRPLCAQVRDHLAANGLFACEMGHTQGPALLAMLQTAGDWARLEVLPDLQGLPRVLVAERDASSPS